MAAIRTEETKVEMFTVDPRYSRFLGPHNCPQIAEMWKYLGPPLQMLVTSNFSSSNNKHTLMCINRLNGNCLSSTAEVQHLQPIRVKENKCLS